MICIQSVYLNILYDFLRPKRALPYRNFLLKILLMKMRAKISILRCFFNIENIIKEFAPITEGYLK